MTPLRALFAYYVGNALPFATGFAFALLYARLDQPWYVAAAAGAVLVVAGPLVIRFLLTLVLQALRGIPGDHGERQPRRTAGGGRLAGIERRSRLRGR